MKTSEESSSQSRLNRSVPPAIAGGLTRGSSPTVREGSVKRLRSDEDQRGIFIAVEINRQQLCGLELVVAEPALREEFCATKIRTTKENQDWSPWRRL